MKKSIYLVLIASFFSFESKAFINDINDSKQIHKEDVYIFDYRNIVSIKPIDIFELTENLIYQVELANGDFVFVSDPDIENLIFNLQNEKLREDFLLSFDSPTRGGDGAGGG